MNERALVSGLLSGRLTPRDTAGVNVHDFEDVTLRRCFFAVETLRMNGMEPSTRRALVAFDAMGWPNDGIAELLDQLRGEG